MAKAEDEAKMRARTGQNLPAPTPTEGETPPQVLEASKYLAGVPRILLTAILEGEFDAHNLHKLRAMHADEDSEMPPHITFSDTGGLRLQKEKGKMRDSGTKRNVCEKGSINYMKAVTLFFGPINPRLPLALLGFLYRIIQLQEAYIREKAVLPLALTHDADVIAEGQSNVNAWTIPTTVVNTLCTPSTTTGSWTSTTRTSSNPPASTASRKRTVSRVEVLVIEIDTKIFEARLPQDKPQKAVKMATEYAVRDAITLREAE